MRIQDWAEADRPREKLLERGAAALTDAELLAILIGSGTVSMTAVDLAKHILASAENDLYRLSSLSITDLCRFRGIGEAKAVTIASALELGRRRREREPSARPKVVSSSDAYDMLAPHLSFLQHEEFWVLYLNRSGHVLKKQRISQGGVAATIADAAIIFRTAIEQLAYGIVLAHNHPSGQLVPSAADKALTEKVKQAANLFDMKLVDHIIVTDAGYYSFCDEGVL